MSLGSFFKRALKKVVPTVVGGLTGGFGGAIAGATTRVRPGAGVTAAMPGYGGMMGLPNLPPMGHAAMLPAITGIGRALLPAAGRAVVAGARLGRRGLQIISKNKARALGYIITGGLVYDAAGNLIGETSTRRMNPLNARALTRSIRRVCAAKKISKKIEKLTGGGPRRAARCAPRRAKC